jgi:hypothetical protein
MEVFEHKFVDWSGIANPEICAYDVSVKYKNLGLQDLASLNKVWDQRKLSGSKVGRGKLWVNIGREDQKGGSLI